MAELVPPHKEMEIPVPISSDLPQGTMVDMNHVFFFELKTPFDL